MALDGSPGSADPIVSNYLNFWIGAHFSADLELPIENDWFFWNFKFWYVSRTTCKNRENAYFSNISEFIAKTRKWKCKISKINISDETGRKRPRLAECAHDRLLLGQVCCCYCFCFRYFLLIISHSGNVSRILRKAFSAIQSSGCSLRSEKKNQSKKRRTRRESCSKRGALCIAHYLSPMARAKWRGGFFALWSLTPLQALLGRRSPQRDRLHGPERRRPTSHPRQEVPIQFWISRRNFHENETPLRNDQLFGSYRNLP